MSDFEIRSAVRVNTPAFVALAGPSGSGKTRSALELATGLAGDDGKILLADTEGNRGLHYADLYKFDHVEFRPNYTPERCAELIDLAEKHGYAVLVLDSASDEYEGEGGLQEIRDQTNDEFWAKTKARHKHALINRIRRSRIHVIFCLRCEERVKIEKVQGRTVIVPLGWMPICEKRFLYEMQSSFRFDPDHPGVPVPIKLYDIHAQFFPPDRPITRDAGRALAAWAAGAPVPAPQKPADDPIVIAGWDAAVEGTSALAAFWKDLNASNRRRLVAIKDTEWKPTAEEADRANEASADTPPSGAGAASVSSAVPASSQELSDGASGRGERAADALCLAPVQSSEGSAATDAPRGSDNDPPPRGEGEAAGARGSRREPVADAATHGSPELDADAAKLIAMGADPGPTFVEIDAPGGAAGKMTELGHRLTEAASKGLKYFDRVWVHVLTPEERAIAAPMCGHYREIAQRAGG